MNGSSAKQLEFEDLIRPQEAAEGERTSVPKGRVSDLRTPSFQGYVYAATARKAGRMNASAATDAELKALLRERAELLDKLLDKSITRREENRLAYVRWSLDRIEDARHGDALDELESAISRYEQFAADIHNLRQQLGAVNKSRR